MTNPVVSWAKDHPVAAGAAALGVIVVVMLATGGSSSQADSGASGGMGSAGLQAYYAAVANQAQAGAAIQTAEIAANADVNKALIAANYGIESAKIWQPVQLASVANDAAKNASDAQLANKSLDYNREISIFAIETQHQIDDNHVNLANAALAQEQNIAFKKINASKPSFGSQLLGAVTSLGTAYLSGGTSLLGNVFGGSGAAKLPSMGSSGQWV